MLVDLVVVLLIKSSKTPMLQRERMNDVPMNYYEVLGCSKDATAAEIKRAYRHRLLQFHPDKSGSMDSREFRNVREAWQVLGHPQSRKRYDAACRQAELEDSDDEGSEDGPVYAHLSLSDLEESVFGDVLFYRCRCGDRYFIDRDDLPEKNTLLHVTCDGCTLIIVVKT